jgi:hypothetical protein
MALDSLPRSGDITADCKRIGADSMVSAADFERAAGSVFTVSAGGRQFSLELTQVRRIEASPRDGGGFTLLFKGPREVRLPQAIYHFTSDTITDDIFIVPISADATGHVYEAVFN